MMERVIVLISKYNEITKLIPLNENIYKVDFTENPYCCRIIYNQDNSIEAFDPPGGPFISIGYEVLPNLKVTSICIDENTKDLLVTLE